MSCLHISQNEIPYFKYYFLTKEMTGFNYSFIVILVCGISAFFDNDPYMTCDNYFPNEVNLFIEG